MVHRVTCLLVLTLLQAVAIGQNKTTPPAFPEIDAAMQRYVDARQVAGVVTLVGHRGRIVHFGAVGQADLSLDRSMKRYTLFSIASMTKPIVASGIMMLQDAGKLDVNDNVSKYLPAFAQLQLKDGTPAAREITIRDAITHTSGLAGNQVFEGSLQAAVDRLADRPLAFQPGTRWQYSPGLNVAGRIIEVVSGEPLQEFLKARIFTPLGMNGTGFYPDEKQQRRLAALYRPSEDGTSLELAGNRITKLSKEDGPNPSGGLISNARDMFRFYQMILNGGRLRRQRLLSKTSVEAMLTPQTGELATGFTPGNSWGLGWCIVREPQGVSEMLSPGSYGHGGAFGTQGWVDPKTQTIYVLMIQRTGFGNSDGSEIRQTFQQVASDLLARKPVTAGDEQ